MIAALLAKSFSPHTVSGPINQSIHSSFQRVMYANRSSPGEQPGGEQKLSINQLVILAEQTPRLTTCFPLRGTLDVVCENPNSNHHQ